MPAWFAAKDRKILENTSYQQENNRSEESIGEENFTEDNISGFQQNLFVEDDLDKAIDDQNDSSLAAVSQKEVDDTKEKISP